MTARVHNPNIYLICKMPSKVFALWIVIFAGEATVAGVIKDHKGTGTGD